MLHFGCDYCKHNQYLWCLVNCMQVSADAAELRGSLRFMACLFKEHLLPNHFIHTLVLDFLGHVQAR